MKTYPTGIRQIPDYMRHWNALDIFRSGYDSADIAWFRRVHEATVMHWIHDTREKRNREALISKERGTQ